MPTFQDPFASFVYPQPTGTPASGFTSGGYPYPTGYAQINDVASRVNAGTWDPTKSTAAPSTAQVEQWLIEATAAIDAALATRGYFVPLQPADSFVAPAGMTTWNGVGVGAWLLLRNVCAAYATSFVESTRHGDHTTASHDPQAAFWMELYDDFLTRVETSADNLQTWGVGGPFAPDIDPAHGADSGSLGALLSDASQQEGPLFTKTMNLGSGWENTPAANPSGNPNLTGSP